MVELWSRTRGPWYSNFSCRNCAWGWWIPPRTANRNAFQSGQRCVSNRDGSVPIAMVQTLMLQIWDFGRLGLQALDLGLASESPTVRECRERDSWWLVVASVAAMVAGVAATCIPDGFVFTPVEQGWLNLGGKVVCRFWVSYWALQLMALYVRYRGEVSANPVENDMADMELKSS
ncbi:hypothetical protein Acr_26g0001430 [Actinidia rufa]|uniref:Uncharacterized protein n=1 Tax=Actinidia rufa TaxID=165716 RepID=A0A7J0H1A5_9ERIC|nr:hypothetical protein Acr_26g0001430 [Actinidia rufa]